MVFTLCVPAFSMQSESDEMDKLDIIISAFYYLNSEDSTSELISEKSKIDKIIPLFNVEGEVVANYITLMPKGYAVVNNNINNPTVIEFGDDRNSNIEEIILNSSNPHIIYNNPFDVYDLNSNSERKIKSNSAENDIFDYYPNLQQTNTELANQQNEYKQYLIENQMITRSDNDFGFINSSNMPSGSYSGKTIASATSTDWAIMGDFSDIARDHCGATTVTNLALYFAQTGKFNLKKNNSNRDTFEAVHKIVGNGPEMTIAEDAKQYFKDRGYTLNYSGVSGFSGVETALKNNRPCGILLENGLFSWHWIIAVGYRNYNSGDNYIQVMNNWKPNINIYYMANNGSAWVSRTQYWVD